MDMNNSSEYVPLVDPDTVCVRLSAEAMDVEKRDSEIVLGFKHSLNYRNEGVDHWQHPDEFVWNGYTGDCEDHSFFIQSVLLAREIPCVSVWEGNHIWNEVFIEGKYWERYEGQELRPRSHDAILMTAEVRMFPQIWRKQWRWVRYEPEWKDRF